MSFGNRLADLRKTANLTRKELAKILNISYSALSNYETNERFPDQEMLIKISDFFGVSIDYLLGRVDINKFSTNPNIEYYSIDEELALWIPKNTDDDRVFLFSNPMIERIKGLSKESKKSLLEYVELLELRDMQKRNQANDAKSSE